MKRIICLCLFLVLAVGCTVQKETLIIPDVNSVYYEVFVGSFYDSDGDGMGDLNGVTQKLDYIRSLGATGIWLMPIHPSPTYHKYDVTDYKAIDSQYGTMEDFDNLVKAMNERGMDLILDLVINHSSAQHPWFIEARNAAMTGSCETTDKCEYYHFSETMQPGYSKLNDKLYYESVFWDQMPDLNLQNDKVRDEIKDIMAFWLNKGIKGFRLDATTHYEQEDVSRNVEVLNWVNNTVKSIKRDAYIVGEAWTSNTIVEKMYASNIDSFFNFDMSQNSGRIIKSIQDESGASLAKITEDHQKTLISYNKNAVDAVFLSNHDNNRSAGYLSNDFEKQKLTASIYLLMPGNVFVYYGEEISMLGSGKDENKRLPMPWSTDGKGVAYKPSGADYSMDQPLTVEAALKDKKSLLYHYQKVINTRNKYQSIARGSVIAIDVGNASVYAMDHGDVVVIHNVSKSIQTFTLDTAISDTITLNGSSKNKNGAWELSPYTTVVIIK